jgi:glutamate synthase (NADPH/NADH) small chain
MIEIPTDGGIEMSTPTGFMEYKRELQSDRDPLERIKDWNEFHRMFS